MDYKKKYDIGILTVSIEYELPAILKIFNLDLDQHQKKENIIFWTNRIYSNKLGQNLNVVIAVIGEQGTTPASVFTTKFINLFDPSFLILVGTAAGIKGKVSLCDVVVSKRIIGYERARKEKEDTIPRPIINEIHPKLLTDIQLYNVKVNSEPENLECNWKNLLREKLEGSNIPVEDLKIHICSIASGDKLIVNGSLEQLRRNIDEKMYAAEMEGVGFSQAAKEWGKLWMVVRGISDFGDPESKNGKYKDKYHFPATLSAAAFVYKFLECGYSFTYEENVKKNERELIEELEPLPIKAAIFSTADKSNLEVIIPFLVENGVKIIASPGTADYIRNVIVKRYNLTVKDDQIQTPLEYTKSVSIAEVRGTLHPYIMAGIKTDRRNKEAMKKLKENNLEKIDLVVINAPQPIIDEDMSPKQLLDLISEVQIGGPSLLRWAIRQWRTCSAIVDPEDYQRVVNHLKNNNMCLMPAMRLTLFRKALQYLSQHDMNTSKLFKRLWPEV